MVATLTLGQGTPDTFLRLRDTPDSYVGQALKFVRVNAAENRLEFAAGAGGGAAWGAITGTLSDQTDLQAALDAKVPTTRTLTIGGTALDLSANRSWLGNVTDDTQTKAAIVPNTAPSSGQILVGNAGGTAYAKQTLSGSGATATLSSAGVLTLSAIPNATLSNSAITIAGTSTSLGGSITLDTITGLGSNGIVKRTGANTLGIAASGTDYEVPLTFSQSVSRAVNTVTLSGDSASPGNSKYYGTDSGGTKGYFALPSGGASVANPGSQLLGLSVINGSASTAMRSDGAPALDQGIAPTWTAAHAWSINDAVTNTTTTLVTIGHNSTGTVATNFGSKILFKSETSTTADVDQAYITSQWEDVTHSNRRSYMDFGLDAAGGGPVSAMRLFMGTGGQGSLSVGSTTNPNANGVINANAGYRIANAAANGTILQGNGSTFIVSAPTWPTSAGTSGYQPTSDATNFVNYPKQLTNSSTTSQSSTFASDTYVTGSDVTVAAGDFKAKGQYHCRFDMVKTNAGTQTPIINVRIGTAGTTGDTSRITFTFGNGTAVADTGSFEVWVNFRTVGSGTSAVVSGTCEGKHNLATTGLFNNAASWTIVGTVSGGFDSSTATKIGVSFNGGTSFSGTVTTVQAQLEQ